MNKGCVYKRWPDEAVPTSYVFTTMAMPGLPRWLPAKPACREGNSHEGLFSFSFVSFSNSSRRAVEITPKSGSSASSQPGQLRSRTPVPGLKYLGPFPLPGAISSELPPPFQPEPSVRSLLLLWSLRCRFTGWVSESRQREKAAVLSVENMQE